MATIGRATHGGNVSCVSPRFFIFPRVAIRAAALSRPAGRGALGGIRRNVGALVLRVETRWNPCNRSAIRGNAGCIPRHFHAYWLIKGGQRDQGPRLDFDMDMYSRLWRSLDRQIPAAGSARGESTNDDGYRLRTRIKREYACHLSLFRMIGTLDSPIRWVLRTRSSRRSKLFSGCFGVCPLTLAGPSGSHWGQLFYGHLEFVWRHGANQADRRA